MWLRGRNNFKVWPYMQLAWKSFRRDFERSILQWIIKVGEEEEVREAGRYVK